MSAKNNSVASQALLDLESIRGAIKEESKNTLKTLLSEAVKDYIRESADEEDDEDMTIEKEDTEDTKKHESDDDNQSTEELEEDGLQQDEEMPAQDGEMPEGEGGMPSATDAQEAPMDGEGEGDDMMDVSQYQVGGDPNVLDLTNADDATVYTVYKSMKDDDQIVVKMEGNMLKLQDNEAGTEYIVDLGDDIEDNQMGEEMTEGCIKEGEKSDLYELSLPDEFDDEDFDEDDDEENDDEPAGLPENKKTRKTMKENKEFELVLEGEIHDYTDNYQNVDPIKGLSASEPSKSGKSWEKGVPTGTNKPWAGDSKSKGKPFGKKAVDEEAIEENQTVTTQPSRKTVKQFASDPRSENLPKVSKHVSSKGKYNETLGESYKKVVADLMAENKKLKEALEAKKAENKELKETVLQVRTGLHEQRVTNVNIAKCLKLFVENAVSQDEKASIINRFSNEAKTIEQSKALYESISKELKKGKTSGINLNEGSMTVEGSQKINETKVERSKDLLETLDFIKRMEFC